MYIFVMAAEYTVTCAMKDKGAPVRIQTARHEGIMGAVKVQQSINLAIIWT